MHAHNASGFDTLIILNSSTCERKVVNLIKTGKGIISLKNFNGNVGYKPQ